VLEARYASRIDPRDESALLWFFNERQGDIGRDVRSAQPGWEAALEARAKMQRHRFFVAKDDRGLVFCGGTDLRCGCTVHRHGIENESAPDEPETDRSALESERQIGDRLWAADILAPTMVPPWSCLTTPSGVLALRFHDVLPIWRIPFGLEGLAGRTGAPQGRKLGLMAVAKTRLRGAGSVAHLTPAAISAHAAALLHGFHGGAATYVDRLGGHLRPREGCKLTSTEAERMLGRQIARESLALVLFAWNCYRRTGSGMYVALRPRQTA
jgi:hypothetical protein